MPLQHVARWRINQGVSAIATSPLADDQPAKKNQREHILDVALQLMSMAGSTGVSMRQLATACGVQVATIYHYFPSKDALLKSVFEERQYDTRLEQNPIDIDSALNPQDRLKQIYLNFWNGALEEEPVLRLLLGEAIRSEDIALPTGASLLEIFRSGVLALLETHLPELEEPKPVAEVFVGSIFLGFITHIFQPDLDTDVIGEQQATVLLASIF